MGPLLLGDVTKDSQKTHLGLHSEVALLRDVARVPKEPPLGGNTNPEGVEAEAEVEEAPAVEQVRSDKQRNCIDLKRGPR